MENQTSEKRKCYVCKEYKPVDEFAKCKRRGFQTKCKECSRELNRQWFKKNQNKINSLARERREIEKRKRLSDAKSNILQFPVGNKGYRTEDYAKLVDFNNRLCLLTESEIGYLAGIFDGEGCISRVDNHGSKGGFMIRTLIYNTSLELMKWIDFALNTNSRQVIRNGLKPIYVLSLSGYRAILFLQFIVPHLRVKRELANTVMVEFKEAANG